MTTSSDKAKSKLLDSMRMSKQGTGEAPAAEAPAASAAPKKPAPAKKAPGKKAPAKKAPGKPAARKTASAGSYSSREGRAQIISDVFQSGQRIWPD